MGSKSRSNYALSQAISEERFNEIFDIEEYVCLNCDHKFNQTKKGFYYPDYGLPMPADVCPKCQSVAYEIIDDKQSTMTKGRL